MLCTTNSPRLGGGLDSLRNLHLGLHVRDDFHRRVGGFELGQHRAHQLLARCAHASGHHKYRRLFARWHKTPSCALQINRAVPAV